MTTSANGKSIWERLEERPEIRPFPAATTKLLVALKDPSAHSLELAKIIETDPGLSARLLRMANSPLFGLSNVIRTIEHATMILGMRRLRNLALAAAGAVMFAEGKTAARQREELWHHSLGCATMSRLVAKCVSTVDPDEAFLAGIFHDVGKLFFLDVIPGEYSCLTKSYTGEKLVDQEKGGYGVTHEEIGIKSATAWQLAEEIKVAIGYHHRPEATPAHFEFTAVVHLANSLARNGGIGSKPDARAKVCEPVVQRLGLDQQTLDVLQGEGHERFAETRQTFLN